MEVRSVSSLCDRERERQREREGGRGERRNALSCLSRTGFSDHDHDLVVVEDVVELLHALVHGQLASAFEDLGVGGGEGFGGEGVDGGVLHQREVSEGRVSSLFEERGGQDTGWRRGLREARERTEGKGRNAP